MAPGRLYRDYSSEKDSFDIPAQNGQRRNGELRKELYDEAPGSPATVVPEIRTEEDDTNTKYYGAGIAQTTDDSAFSVTTADTETESSPEPMLLQEQVEDDFGVVSAAPAPAIAYHLRERGLSPSVTSASRVSQDVPQSPGARSSSSRKMPEFFSPATFQTVLNNPAIAHQFQKFAQSRLCGENLGFLSATSRYRGLLEDISKAVYEIHKEFISPSSANQINLPEPLHRKVNTEMKSSLARTLPSLENIFVDAQHHIEDLVYRDVYRKFVQYQMSVSAGKALGRDRSKYAGLGDCFVLTNPSLADDPIVYASDGFVNVTGYQRNEIIPRNCRFLQSRGTDKEAVRRLKVSLEKRVDSVELLLNTKKNGEPFWNLLYTTPLFDENGKLIFFLGGQINCSTTIHNASDVLRILAQSNEPEEDPALARTASPLAVKPSRSRTILSAFRLGSNYQRQSVQPRAPGMEDSLLNQLGDKPLKDQMKSFYTAYSNFVVINYSSWLISFVSPGILDLLFPIKARNMHQAQVIGSDVFKFLANHGTGSVGSDFKSAVKSNLKMGVPISLELKLCARPYMGFDRFVLHWTPLKDQHGAVHWVVLTLGNEQRVGLAL